MVEEHTWRRKIRRMEMEPCFPCCFSSRVRERMGANFGRIKFHSSHVRERE
jgi:hypothetical protein